MSPDARHGISKEIEDHSVDCINESLNTERHSIFKSAT